MILEDAIQINPHRNLPKTTIAPCVAMGDLAPFQRKIEAIRTREYKGSGSRFRNGDTLLARITPCLENGKTAFISELPVGTIAYGSTEFIVLSGREGLSDNLFVYYLARNPNFRIFATQLMEGTSGRQRVPAHALARFNVELPPLPEQQVIAAILGALDDKIELNRHMNQTLEAMAQALFKSWFVDFEPFRDKGMEDSPLGPIPRGWRVGEIGKEVKVLGGSTPSTKEPIYWQGGKYCWATPKDLSTLNSPILLNTERRITDAGLETISSRLLPAGVVLLSSRAPIGYLAIFIVSVAINQGFIAMVCDQRLPNYYTLLWANYNLDDIKARANGTTFLEISKSSFRPMPVIVPKIEVMNQFNKIVEPFFMRITENLKESHTLAAIRDALLPKLLSGELRVKDAEKFMGEAA